MSDCFECQGYPPGSVAWGEHDANDVNSLALCAWKEARGEGCVGMRAVMHVILNRAGYAGFAKTLHDVIFGKNQFTSMSVPTDPEFNLEPKDGDQLFTAAVKMAGAILNASDYDITGGAHYYYNPATATSGWFVNNIVKCPNTHPKTAEIGHHWFFK